MPLQATSGAASYDGFGGGVSAVPNYIEDVFSTYLWTGTGSSQTITNGIDLSTKGGLVWIKPRASATTKSNSLWDTLRGAQTYVSSNLTNGNISEPQGLTAFNSNGFTIGTNTTVNESGYGVASWTFRKQPKFFDVVTYTGTGSATTIAHNLGSVPGCIIVKSTSQVAGWQVYHQSLGNTKVLNLDTTIAAATGIYWNNTSPTSTQFTVGPQGYGVNNTGITYVAYLFAHDAGGFGLTGTDNVISCGSFTTDGSGNATVNLGYEPQWVLVKSSINATGWIILDTMRGWDQSSNDRGLAPNSSGAESTFSGQYGTPTATGFTVASNFGISDTNIYIAIRRGPMKVPTSGTSVYAGVARTGTSATAQITSIGFTPDFIIGKPRTGYAVGTAEFDRLKGVTKYLAPSWTDAEISDSTMVTSFNMDGVSLGADTVQKYFNDSSGTYINWLFKRAPSFFDEVCYAGNDVLRTINHNLGVAPEMMIIKVRDTALGWAVYHSGIGNTKYLFLNTTDAAVTDSAYWNNTSPTASVFTVNTSNKVNSSPSPYVAYLFATCAGVSKCTAFTGTGSLQTINCGFTSGSRFILIKRTDAAGDWYVWDSSRGLSSSTDPYLLLNSTAAEVTSTNWVDTTSTGFQVTAASGNNVNISGATYIALAIA